MKKTIALLTACGLLLTSATACGSGTIQGDVNSENSVEDTVETSGNTIEETVEILLNCEDDGAAWMSLVPDDYVKDADALLNSIAVSNGSEEKSDLEFWSALADVMETSSSGQLISIDNTVEYGTDVELIQTLIETLNDCEYLVYFDANKIDKLMAVNYSYCEYEGGEILTDTCSLFMYEGNWYSLEILSSSLSFNEAAMDAND